MLELAGFPVIVAILFVLTAAVSMLLSALFVRYRDVAIIWGVAVSALFYGSPILYPYEFVPEQFRELFAINPLTPLLAEARHADYRPTGSWGGRDGGRLDRDGAVTRDLRGALRGRGLVLQPRGASRRGAALRPESSGGGGTSASGANGPGRLRPRASTAGARPPAIA